MNKWSNDDNGEWDDEESALVDCPACGTPIHEDAVRCPACGEYVSWNESPLENWPAWALWLALLGVLAVIAAVIGFLG